MSQKKSVVWTEESGIIRFSVTTQGITHREWVDRLKHKYDHVSFHVKGLLYFKPTLDIKFNIAVVKGDYLGGVTKTTQHIRFVADRYGFEKLPVETCFYMRDLLSDIDLTDMSVRSLVVLGEPFDFTALGRTCYFGISNNSSNLPIGAYYDCNFLNDGSENIWNPGFGFAFHDINCINLE